MIVDNDSETRDGFEEFLAVSARYFDVISDAPARYVVPEYEFLSVRSPGSRGPSYQEPAGMELA